MIMSDTPITFDQPIPEHQLSPSNYPSLYNPILGTLTFTGGFMEPKGHSYKSNWATTIKRSREIEPEPPGHRNNGVDYTKGFGSKVQAWYSGEVTRAGREGGYGYRIHIRTDLKWKYEGKVYPIFMAYAHCSTLLKNPGQHVAQGEAIGIEAGHGLRGPNDYGSHVDLDCYIKTETEHIHLNPICLSYVCPSRDSGMSINTLTSGDWGLTVIWAQTLLAVPRTGYFDGPTLDKVKSFQASKGLKVDGVIGQVTGIHLGLTDFALIATTDTVIKDQPINSTKLLDNQKIALKKHDLMPAELIEGVGGHWEFTSGDKVRYAFKEHVTVLKGFQELLPSKESPNNDYWDNILTNAKVQGAGTRTSAGLTYKGVKASGYYAKADFDRIKDTPGLLDTITTVGNQFNVPVALLLGLASRESRIGAALTNQGWGDNNKAFGIFQVDKRYHQLVGTNSPTSKEHILQAVKLFVTLRDGVKRKHPNWSNEYILRGACVAYNSGLGNVCSIEYIDKGTANEDYSSDVIARAQCFQAFLKELK
jgi:peptidoglycan hydrolase-like protein with peptidoglycan-binding domain